MNNKIQYHQIRHSPDPYEAAYIYLEQQFGAHVPYMFADLTGHLVRAVEYNIQESVFKRDAQRMYNL